MTPKLSTIGVIGSGGLKPKTAVQIAIETQYGITPSNDVGIYRRQRDENDTIYSALNV